MGRKRTEPDRRYVEDLTVKNLVDRWAEGDRAWVVAQLWDNPPHLTATFLAMGSDEWYGDKRLRRADVDRIANMLTDKFIARRDANKEKTRE